MMQHLATQKAETAADLLFNKQQEQKHSERGQEFAELMQRNKVSQSSRDSISNAQQRTQQVNRENAYREQASRQRIIENERHEAAQMRASEQREEMYADARDQMEAAAEKRQAQSEHSRLNKQRSEANPQKQVQTSQSSENNSAQHDQENVAADHQAQTDEPETQLADSAHSDAQTDNNAVDDNDINASDASEQVNDDTAFTENAYNQGSEGKGVEFDWLSMLDKLHGKNQVDSDELTQLDGQTGIDANLVDASVVGNNIFDTEASVQDSEAIHAADILKNFADAQVKADEVVETDDMVNTEAELTDQESLTDILAMLDQLRSEEAVSNEDLAAFDNMIQDFMAKHPELADSPLKHYESKDWLKLDSKLLQGIIKSATDISPVTATVDKQLMTAEADLVQGLISADAQQLQKTAEHLARNVLPKELNNAENRTTFVDNLKIGLEEMKAQLKNGGETDADLSQVVKDALATIDGVSKADINGARLQQTLAMSATTLETASQFSDPKTGLADAVKSQATASAKDPAGAATLAELNKQQTGQMERLVNMHKPEAAQQMADKVQVMMNQKSLVADIRLDPPHLGGMKIKVDMSGEAASVNFVVQTQQAREALEQATPRLRELLDEQGIELGQSSVEQEAKQHNNADGDGKMAGNGGGTETDDSEEEDLPEAQTINMVNGSVNGIDYFA